MLILLGPTVCAIPLVVDNTVSYDLNQLIVKSTRCSNLIAHFVLMHHSTSANYKISF